jgi:hypothetical protein
LNQPAGALGAGKDPRLCEIRTIDIQGALG